MAEETHLYRYTSNKNPWDSTASIVVAMDDDGNPTKVLDRGGAPVALTDAEAEVGRARYNLTKLSDEKAEEYEVVDDAGHTTPKPEDEGGPSRRSRNRAKSAPDQPADQDAGGVVDPAKGGSAGVSGDDSGSGAGGQGTRGATGQDVGTTTGGAS